MNPNRFKLHPFHKLAPPPARSAAAAVHAQRFIYYVYYIANTHAYELEVEIHFSKYNGIKVVQRG